MKRGQFSQEQIVGILHQAERGEQTIQALCKEHSITETTFYRWRRAYGGMTVSEASRLKTLEQEERSPQAAARRTRPGSGRFAGVGAKKVADPAFRDALLAHLQQRGLSQRAACRYTGVNRSRVRYTPRPDHNADLLVSLVA